MRSVGADGSFFMSAIGSLLHDTHETTTCSRDSVIVREGVRSEARGSAARPKRKRDADRGSFASLVAVLQATGNLVCFVSSASKGLSLQETWRTDCPMRSQLRQLMGDVALDRMLQSQPVRQQGRQNIPQVHPWFASEDKARAGTSQ